MLLRASKLSVAPSANVLRPTLGTGRGGRGNAVCWPFSLKTIIPRETNRYGCTSLPRTDDGRQILAWPSVVAGLALLAAVASGLSFLGHIYGVVIFPYELAAGEELLLRDTLHILGGRPIYTDVNDFPFIVSNYPPLFAAVSSLLVPFVGRSLAATRLVAGLCTLLNGALVAAIIYHGGRLRTAAVTCGAAYLGSIFVYQWGAWGRVDSLAIALSLLAILVAKRSTGSKGITLAALFCLLSLYTKQTEWAALLAIVVWLGYERRWRLCAGFVLLLGVAGGTVFLALNALTSGEFFRHLVLYNTLPYSLRALLGYWRAFAATHGIIVGVAFGYAATSAARRRFSLPVLYFFACTLLTVAVGRAGASSNYFVEMIAASLILCGLWWGELSGRATYASAVVPAALLVQVVWFGFFAHTPLRAWYDPLPSFGYTPQTRDVAACARVDRYVNESDGEILTEAGGFALKNGKELYTSPWMLSALEPTGKVDRGLERLEEALAEHRFSLVILTWQSYPPRILDAVWANYERVETIDCVFKYEVFVPRGSG